MEKMKCLVVAAILGVLTGCATTTVTTGDQTLSADPDGDGVIRQKTQFKDLPADMQETILHGG